MDLFPIHYFPSIEYYAHLVQSEGYIFEREDNFRKQTYRNRAYIYGANGKLALNIPIQHKNGSRSYKDTQLANETDWQLNHLKSLKTAYQSSPYFEYYEDKFTPLFKEKEQFLFDFNLKCFQVVNQLLKIEVELQNKIDTVLVSVKSFDNLKAAYPNYFVDISDFLNILKNIMFNYSKYNENAKLLLESNHYILENYIPVG